MRAAANITPMCTSPPARRPPNASEKYPLCALSPSTYLICPSRSSPSSGTGFTVRAYLSRVSRCMAPDTTFSSIPGNTAFARTSSSSLYQSRGSKWSKCSTKHSMGLNGRRSSLPPPMYFSTDSLRPHLSTDTRAASIHSPSLRPSNGTGRALRMPLADTPCSSVVMANVWLGSRCISSTCAGMTARSIWAVAASHRPVTSVLHRPVISLAKSFSYALAVCVARVTLTPNLRSARSISLIVALLNMCASSTYT